MRFVIPRPPLFHDRRWSVLDLQPRDKEMEIEVGEDDRLQDLSREELIQLVRKLTQENQSYSRREQQLQQQLLNRSNSGAGGSDDETIQKKTTDIGAKVEFGSFGSSNVMFLKNENENENNFNPTEGLKDSQSYRGSGLGSIQGPDVTTDHRNLFKKSVVLEYEADSPAFRKKIEIMVSLPFLRPVMSSPSPLFSPPPRLLL
jgi:hypothetical protein